ncbi:hypothetical protein O3M35_012130 [Rhynocoris fuscipes]|uniref:Gustatory receptor n=1 Tax=Rhynocoris fuscipes TaxID=488301 RepID=A0AAW1CSX7_9HEMI
MENIVKSLNFLPKLCGLYPFDITDKKHSLNRMQFLIALPMHILFWCSIFVETTHASNNWTPLDYLQLLIRMYAVAAAVHSTLLWMIFNMKVLDNILNDLKTVENSLNKVGLVFQYKINYKYMIFTTCMFLISMVLAWFSSNRLWYPTTRMIINYCFIFEMYIQSEHLSNYLLMISKLFSMLSLNTKNIQHFNDSNKTIDIFLYCHDLLKSVCASLNILYAPLLVLTVTTCFARVTLAIFSILDFKSTFSVAYLSAIAVAYTLPAFRIATVCSHCIYKANEFDDTIFSLVHLSRSENLVRNIKLQLHIANRNVIQFTALGLFQIDVGVLGKMIVTCITYLVIMVQLKDQFKLDQVIKNNN